MIGWAVTFLIIALIVNRRPTGTPDRHKRDPTFLRFERLALAPSELAGVAEMGRARVVV